jgi:hypothetical protein
MMGAAVAGCTPSYMNGEGDIDKLPMEEKMKMAGSGTYGKGIVAYVEELEEWRSTGRLEGLEISDGDEV